MSTYSIGKNCILSCLCVGLTLSLNAQRSDQHKLILDDLYPGEAVETFDLRERKKIYQSFLIDEWLFGRLLKKDGSLSEGDYLLKYDILNRELNVNLNGSAFIVPDETISGFILKEVQNDKLVEHKFRYYETEDKKIHRGIFKHCVDGNYKLLAFYDAEKLPSNYVPALDAGSLDQKISTRERFYFMAADQLIEIPSNKKRAEKFFNKYEEARKFLEKNRMNYKNKEQLKALVNFMNQTNLKS